MSSLAHLFVTITLSASTFIQDATIEIGDGRVLEGADILFDSSGIKAVGNLMPPKDSTLVDGRGKVVTPGLIETLTQLGLVEVGMESSTVDHRSSEAVNPAFSTAAGYNPRSSRIAINRTEGITSIIASPTGGLISGTGIWAPLDGSLEPLPTYRQPIAMFASLRPGGSNKQFPSKGAQWLRLREIFEDVRFYRKNIQDYQRGKSRPLSLSKIHLDAMMPVLDRRIPLVFDVHRASDILHALRFSEEEKIRLVLAGATEAWMVSDAIKKANVPVIIKPRAQVPYTFDRLAARDDAPALLHKSGIKIIISSWDWGQNIRRLRQEAGIAVAEGFPRDAVLATLTKNPAEIFGKGAAAVGVLESKKRADLVLWSGDPLELRTRALKVWVNGIPQPLQNRQKDLARRYLPSPVHTAKEAPSLKN